MSDKIKLIRSVRNEFESGAVGSVETLREKLNPITIGGVGKIAVAAQGGRMFRVRRLAEIPTNISQVREPPPGEAPIGRLNEQGQCVLYLSDSPMTAFAENMIVEGVCCLSEWRVESERLGLINGGLSEALMNRYFPKDLNVGETPVITKEDEHILELFREIFTVDVGKNVERYNWSIACGSANGFSHVNDRESEEKIGDHTRITGRTPFSALVYPSIRTGGKSINFALNDRGRDQLSLHHAQWVHRHADGRIQGINFANSFSTDGEIEWQGRPANFVLKLGERARLKVISETEVVYETENGSIPWFS